MRAQRLPPRAARLLRAAASAAMREQVDLMRLWKNLTQILAKAMEGEMDLANRAMEALRNAIENAAANESNTVLQRLCSTSPN